MRSIFCFIAGMFLALQAVALPVRTGQVVDEANVLSEEAETTLNQLFAAEGIDNIIVVTVPSLEGKNAKEYIAALVQEWGLGTENYDDGVLVLIAPNDKVARIDMGKAMFGLLSNAEAGEVLHKKMIPDFARWNYSGAAVAGVQDIISVIKGRRSASTKDSTPSKSSWALWVLAIVVIAGVLGYIFNIVCKSGIGFEIPNKREGKSFPSFFIQKLKEADKK